MVDVRCAEAGGGWSCEVVVHAATPTRHRVTVSAADAAARAVSADRAGVEDLVRRSFAFLLEREPAGAILAAFDLAVIAGYFPEYDSRFRR